MKKFLKSYWSKIVCILFVTLFSCRVIYGEEYKGTYYEEKGCVYLIGNLADKERTKDLESYKERMTKREKQINNGLNRRHDIEIEKIRAEALENYLIAQSLDYSKIVEAIKQRKHNTRIYIGDTISQSNSSVGDITSNSNVEDITNDNRNTNNNK